MRSLGGERGRGGGRAAGHRGKCVRHATGCCKWNPIKMRKRKSRWSGNERERSIECSHICECEKEKEREREGKIKNMNLDGDERDGVEDGGFEIKSIVFSSSY